MAAIHTDAPAIFGNFLVNQAEQKIQYVKLRPTDPFDSKIPINFLIPGNSAQYVSLRDSLLYVECHVEETDRFGKEIVSKSRKRRRARKRKRSVAEDEGGETGDDNGDYEYEDEDEEETVERPIVERQAEPSTPGVNQPVLTNTEISRLLEDARKQWTKAETAKERANLAKINNPSEFERLQTYAEGMEDMAVLSMTQYMQAKRAHNEVEMLDGAIIPVDNFMHSLWNGVDVFMNGELVSTTNQKYMYKAFIETLLNNSATTKKYQLENIGYFGDNGDKDQFYNLTFNNGMEKLH